MLDELNLTYYLIRNERVSELAIYSFDNGERFEPDYLLFLFVRKKEQNKDNPDPYLKEKEKKNPDPYLTYQGYIEPKGAHLIEKDEWKEKLLKVISKKASTQGSLFGNYKIFGLPFYNRDKNSSNFDKELGDFINELKKLLGKTQEATK
ncbi:hypothetical protein CJP74_07690 [Psittacicella melopsittaci]|uniref:Uncharacterized protein n=1 Tax=Psittacicella melopsittaci TaxID=2028576 RepID=A0A3A1Y1K3_9GAMM|nr:hypothetical protein CJP74_07690 [Psittacicella melopsittaci]